MSKKILAFVMALVLVISLVPAVAAAESEIRFEFGANGNAAHVDGNAISATKTYTEGGYQLTLTGSSKVYDGAFDAQGNSCLKLGTSSVVGAFTFTVPEGVNEVVIYAAKYKTYGSTLEVNGTAHTLTKNSNDGQYDEIVVDTSETKTVSVTTVTGALRTMIDAIVFKGVSGSGSITPTEPPVAPTDPAEIVKEAYALAPNASLPYKATLTGTITEVKTPYDSNFDNITVIIEVDGAEDMPITCYRLKGNGADQINLGDTITVSGYITNYQHSSGACEVEFVAGCTLDSWVAGGSTTPSEPQVTEPTEPTTPPETSGALNTGDEVVIFAPAYNKALSAEKVAQYYNKGVDITVDNGTVSGYGDAEIWTVIDNGDGTYSFANGGQNIGLGDSFSSMNLGEIHDDWQLISLGGSLYNLKNVGRGNFMEWYASKDNWSTFASDRADTDDQFQLSFYVIGTGILGEEVEPSEPTPTVPDVTEPIVEPTEPSVAPTEPAGDVLTIPEANELGKAQGTDNYTSDKYKVTGVITDVYQTTYGNLKLTDENGNIFTVYGTYNEDGTVRYDALEVKPVVGDTITVFGIIGNYKGDPQMKNGWIIAHIPGIPEEVDPSEIPDAELSFADVANRTSITAEQQVWQQNGITFTNDKAGSKTDVADYKAPVRLYQSSKITIAAEDMIKIVVACNGEKDYATSLVESIAAAEGVTVSKDGKIVTIEFAEAVDSFVVESLTAQVRVDSIGVYFAGGEEEVIAGDMNVDGEVNNDDVVLLLWHTLFPEDYSLEVSGDLTGDGNVNNDDVVLLLWHTLFPEDYPL